MPKPKTKAADAAPRNEKRARRKKPRARAAGESFILAKRVILVYLLLFALLAAPCASLISIASGRIDAGAAAAAQQSTVALNVAVSRGTIYDCELQRLTNCTTTYSAVVLPTPQDATTLRAALPRAAADSALERLRGGKPIVITGVPATLKGDGITLFPVSRRMEETTPAPQVVGYLDATGGAGLAGVQAGYDDLLRGKTPLRVTYRTAADGRMLTGLPADVDTSGYDEVSGIALTIDSGIQHIAETAARGHIAAGAVVVMEVATSKIRACVSLPDFSPLHVDLAMNMPGSPLINRALTPYNVGSAFKVCVAGAALEQDVSPGFTYTCGGSINVDGVTFHCPEAGGHGKVDMEQALSESCNTYFITLGATAGAAPIYNMAQAAGFGRPAALCAGIASACGTLPSLDTLRAQPAALANFSFGQGDLMATPLQMAELTAAVAGDGSVRPPTLLEGMVDKSGKLSPAALRPPTHVMKPGTAALLRQFMCQVVATGTGVEAMPVYGGAGGKTSTAETGWVRGGHAVLQAWFTGFYPAVNPKYAIVVLAEDGDTGGKTAAPVFKEIADGLFYEGYAE